MIFIIQTIVFIFIAIFTMFWVKCPQVSLGSLRGTSNHVLYLVHGVACSDSINQVQVSSIPGLLLTCSQN